VAVGRQQQQQTLTDVVWARVCCTASATASARRAAAIERGVSDTGRTEVDDRVVFGSVSGKHKYDRIE